MYRRLAAAAAVAGTAATGGTRAAAQPAVQTGAVRGQVMTAEGTPLPSVRLTVALAAEPAGRERDRGAAVRTATAGPDGRFVLDRLPAGAYTVTATRIGYAPQSHAVTVAAGDTRRLTLRLAAVPVTLGGVDVLGQRRETASATRTTTALLDIPQNIQIVGQDVLQQQAALELQDAVRNVSGVTNAHTDQGAYQYFYARGFGLDRANNFRRNGTILFNWADPLQENVERVEVLKGPAGILFGDVEPGAVINLSTKRPQEAPFRRLEVRTGQYGLVRPAVDLTGPLTPGGAVLYRVNASYERSRSFRDVVGSEATFAAPVLAWRPSERTTWTVEGTYLHDSRVGDPGVVSPDGTVAGLARVPVTRFLGEPGARARLTDRSVTSTVEHALGRALGGDWRLRHVAALDGVLQRSNTLYLGAVSDSGRVTRTQYDVDQRFGNFTTALDLTGRLRTGGVEHEVLLGPDYSDSRVRTGRSVYRTLGTTISLSEPAYGQADLVPQPDAWADYATYTRRLGVNVQDQVRLFGDRVQLLAGLRYNRFSSGKLYSEGAQRPAAETPVRARPVSPRLGVVVKPRPWLSAYGSYAESYLVNGFDWLQPDRAVPPTFGKQVEMGLKSNLFGDRLGLTLAAFDLRKRDVYGWAYYDADTPAPDSAAAALGWYTYSGGVHRSRGAELDFHGQVTDRLGLTGSAAYTDARVVRDPAFAAGNRLGNTPRRTASLWATYRPARRAEALELGAGAFYRDAFYGSAANLAGTLVPRSLTGDASAAYLLGRYRAQLTVKNVANATTYIGGFGNTWQPQWPRRVVASVAATF